MCAPRRPERWPRSRELATAWAGRMPAAQVAATPRWAVRATHRWATAALATRPRAAVVRTARARRREAAVRFSPTRGWVSAAFPARAAAALPDSQQVDR